MSATDRHLLRIEHGRESQSNALSGRAISHALMWALGAVLLVQQVVPAFGQPSAQRVAIVFRSRDILRTAADALAAELRAKGRDCELFELPVNDDAAGDAVVRALADYKPSVLATAGVTATSKALKALPDVPVVFFMVPNALDARFADAGGPASRRVAGITSDVSPEDQVDWIARTCPGIHTVALLHSDHTVKTAAALRDAGSARGISIELITARRGAFPEAITALEQSGAQGVLMIPDADVYDSPSVQRLLLWGARSRKPIWTFSPNVVKAGAFAGLYCDSAEVGRQAAGLVLKLSEERKPPERRVNFPTHVGRAVNVHTAKVIGVEVNPDALGSEVVRMGDKP